LLGVTEARENNRQSVNG